MVEAGEPLFLPEDTDLAVALAEEEADTCPSCGLLKVWCRAPEHQFSFEVREEQCHASYALASHRGAENPTKAAIQAAVQFREGKQPDVYAGLGLADTDDGADPNDRP